MQRKSVTSKKVSGDVMLALVQQLSLKSRSKPILHHPDPFWHPDTFFHDTATGEHPGVQKTAQKAVQNLYWLTLKNDVEDWVGSCEPCQRHDRIKTVAPTLHTD